MNLYAAACIAQAAYDEYYASQIPGFIQTHRFFNEGTDTQGIIGTYDDDTLVIAFRGTNSLADWWVNIDKRQFITPYDPKYKARAHVGFFEAWWGVRDATQDIVAESDHKKVMVIGHSQGGAIGIFAALDIAYHHRDLDMGLIVFGCPKVGNEELMIDVLTYVPEATHVINGDDGVVGLPRDAGYAELGFNTVRIGGNDSILPGEKIRDHLVKNYIELLEGN